MQKYRTFLTKKGREKIVAAEAAGTHLALRHVAVGDALDPPTEDLTALRNEVWRGEVNRIQVDAKDAHVLNVEAVIPAQDGGFMVRELGLFDADGDLIAVGRAPDSYKPLVEDGAAKSLLIVFKIIIDNTDVVALSVDDSVVLVTREYLAQQLSLHTTNKDNPHGVTKAQVGLNNVQNYAVATEAEAKEGTSTTKYMTPLSTKQAITKQAATLVTTHVDDKTNPHNVTKSQVGLGKVQDYELATEADAEAGTSHQKYMTPLRTKQAIEKKISSSVDSTSEVTMASSKAIKTVMDKANEAFTSASSGKETIKQAITGTDNKVTIPTNPTFAQLADSIKKISTGRKSASGTSYITESEGKVLITGLKFRPTVVKTSRPKSGNYHYRNISGDDIDELVWLSSYGQSGEFVSSKPVEEVGTWSVEIRRTASGQYGSFKWLAIE